MSPRIPYQTCPLCDSRDIALLIVADCTGHPLYNPALGATQRWLRCAACEHIFTDGHFTEDASPEVVRMHVVRH